jgi:sialate O-acetylesterase
LIKASTVLKVAAVLSCCHATSRADVTLPAIFGDHMVLQRGLNLPVWGSADPGERVTVTAAGQQHSAAADQQGRWRIILNPIASDGPIEIGITGKNRIQLNDVLIGEVWLCSGQSNMGFSLERAASGAKAVTSADRPQMRLFTVGRAHPDQPQTELSGRWEVCTPETAGDFSAVAYFFGAALQSNLDQPIGLIESSWGGTRAEAWIPRESFDALKLPYEPQWTEQWLNPTPDPTAGTQPKPRSYQAPAVVYNGMIAPMAGYAMRGVIWYQGETNTAYPAQYRDVLTALITGWRKGWGQGDYPFLVVQLPNFGTRTRDWPTLRDGQAEVAKQLPNVALAVTIDVGNPKDIHPRDKKTVGERLALAARKIAYGQDIPYSGPTFRSINVTGNSAAIRFDHVYDGLVAKGGTLRGFEIAGADGNFVPAEARIEAEQVIVSAAGVLAPAAVRYGWANDPQCTLYNTAGLPAVPFQAK